MPHLYGHYFTSVSSKPLAICKGDLLAGAGAMAIGLWKFWLRPMRVWLVLWLNWIPSLLIVDLEVKCLELLFWLYILTFGPWASPQIAIVIPETWNSFGTLPALQGSPGTSSLLPQMSFGQFLKNAHAHVSKKNIVSCQTPELQGCGYM